MNIFVLHIDPEKSAQSLCDQHVIRMVRETTQLLSTAHRTMDTIEESDNRFLLVYPEIEPDHPCLKWVMESIHNYNWLFFHAKALYEEYHFRFDKPSNYEIYGSHLYQIPHGYFNVYDHLGRTPFVQQLPEQYKNIMNDDNNATDITKNNNTINAYRNFYINEVSPTTDWTKRTPPDWYMKGIDALNK